MYKDKIKIPERPLFPMLVYSDLVAIPNGNVEELVRLLALSQGRPTKDFSIYQKHMGGYNIIWDEMESVSFPETRWLVKPIPSVVVNAIRIVSMTEPIGHGWTLAAVNSTSNVVTKALFRDMLNVMDHEKHPHSAVKFSFDLEHLSPEIIPRLSALYTRYPSGTVRFAHYELVGDSQEKLKFLSEIATTAKIDGIGVLVKDVPILVSRRGHLIFSRSTVELEILPYLIQRLFKGLGGKIVGG